MTSLAPLAMAASLLLPVLRRAHASSALRQVCSSAFAGPAQTRHGASACKAADDAARTRGFAASAAEDSHDDFKPQAHASGPAAGVRETIEQDLKENKVFVYMKVRDMLCRYS